MIAEMQVPSPGESITEVEISRWLKQDGDYVEKDEELAEIDSDKATLTLNAEHSGVLKIIVQSGTVKVGDVVCSIDTDAKGSPKAKTAETKPSKTEVVPNPLPASKPEKAEDPKTSNYASGTPSPAAAKILAEKNIPSSQVTGTGKDGRITKNDAILAKGFTMPESESGFTGGSRDTERQKMTALRKKLAQRLVSVKNETAMLTTFNEVDMSAMMDIRKQYKEKFKEKHGVNIGFMSFFTKAVTEALALYPAVNGQIDGDEIVYHKYADVGIAVSTPKGLMVPVLRNAETMSLAQIESGIAALAAKARDGKITVDELNGGTFTITNGGVFGSMMSTPIINPPQVAILGMHNIIERPVAVNGKVEIRPMMYVALSYDHRIIDGRESVGFLVKVKEMLENPVKLLFGSKHPHEILLGL
ncbi:MAG: 2-oxoglutarate dehydrogenase complex dihydrolipoyllysine-residue succinyltransferase [Bacteroidia bacterium]|nr:2-oxoglutarate dehydrogenase complex dihydrolipoyllysine-residue succinyltransferase [Bacteroidia bacterium]